jgi:hypothetical protein
MKNHIFIGLFLLLSISIYSQESDKTKELENRLDQLEKQNNDLSLELEELKRSNIDNTVDLTKTDVTPGIQKDQWGKETSFEFSAGILGAYSQARVGILFPKIKNALFMGLFFNVYASMVPLMGIDKSTNSVVENTKVFFTLNYRLGGSSPLFFNFMRVYGYGDISIAAKVPYNTEEFKFRTIIAIGGSLYGGVEIYTSKWLALFMESGGSYHGFFNIMYKEPFEKITINKDDSLAGFGLNFGVKVYLAKIEKKVKKSRKKGSGD